MNCSWSWSSWHNPNRCSIRLMRKNHHYFDAQKQTSAFADLRFGNPGISACCSPRQVLQILYRRNDRQNQIKASVFS